MKINTPSSVILHITPTFKQTPHRHGMKPVAKWHGSLSVVQHDTAREALPERPSQLAESTKVPSTHGPRGLDLNV